jgi:hypothetical protein
VRVRSADGVSVSAYSSANSAVVKIDPPPTPTPTPTPPDVITLGWSRSSEINGEPLIRPIDGGEWTYADAFAATPLRYFENANVQNVANDKASGGTEYVTNGGQQVGFVHIWDAGNYFPFYKATNGDAAYNWASWEHCGVSGDKENRGEYSIRRFTAYVDLTANDLAADSILIAPENELGNMSYVFPINDNVFVYVNGQLAYWGGTDVVAGNNQYGALNRTTFGGKNGIKVRDGVNGNFKSLFPHTDGWVIDLDENAQQMNIKSLLTTGFNRIDIFADDYWQGGGMNKLNLYFQ